MTKSKMYTVVRMTEKWSLRAIDSVKLSDSIQLLCLSKTFIKYNYQDNSSTY